jgi:ParB family chromosome partitioning protein
MKTPSLLDSRKIVSLPVGAIKPNPHQPRRQFEPEELRELGESIRLYGILQPLTVRKTGPTTFELVAGERRLRAAVLAGMENVPCILLNVDAEQSGLLALVENLQRKDLDFIEEAEGLRSLIRSYGMSQEEAARCISKSQSAVANKLRILKLPPDVLEKLRSAGYTERHARALLRLEEPEAQRKALEAIIAGDLTVAKTEAYIEALLRRGEEEKKKRKTPVVVLKDVRIFLNTVTRGLSMMNRRGVRAVCERADTDNELVLTIRIPRREEVSERREEHLAPA